MPGGSIVITDARVWTMDEAARRARAVVIRDGVITYVGSDEGARTEDRGVDHRVDGRGRTLIPGFNDAHGHFIHDGVMSFRCDLAGAKSLAEVYERIRRYAAARPEREVIVAERWDESGWPERRPPTREGLDKAAGGRPVLARRIDGHMAVASSALLSIYDERWTGGDEGIDRASGRLLERPSLDFNLVVPPPDDELLAGLGAFLDKAARLGVTSAQDFANLQYARIWRTMRAAREGDGEDLGLRAEISTYAEHLDAHIEEGVTTGDGDAWLRMGGMKIFADGSVGGHSAYLREPYADRPGEFGLRMFEDDALAALVAKAHGAGIQVRMHVIGDGAVDQGTGAFEALADDVGLDEVRARRHRFEHYEMSDRPLRDRARRLGMVLSMQPNFVGAWSRAEGLYGQRVGDRHHLMNPMRHILAEGHAVAFGSDCMPFGPIVGLRGVVAAPYPHMRMSTHEAVAAYTVGSAFGEHQEQHKGRIRVGAFGDVVLLDRVLPPDAVPEDTDVALTVCDGRIRWNAS